MRHNKQDSDKILANFNSPQLTDNEIKLAETFLVKCLKPSSFWQTFDELRIDTFDNNALKLDFEKTACTSTNLRLHIKRSYYQMQLWIQAPFRDASTLLNAEDYGFVTKNNFLIPEIIIIQNLTVFWIHASVENALARMRVHAEWPGSVAANIVNAKLVKVAKIR